MKDKDNGWTLPQLHHSRIAYDGFVRVRCDDLHFPHNDTTEQYTCIEINFAAVMVVATTSDNQLVINEEYRYPTGTVLLSCPGGRLEPDEDPLVGAKRELIEETGFTAETFSIIGRSHPFPGLCNQEIIYVHAADATRQGEPSPDPTELIRTTLRTEKELATALKDGAPSDGIMGTALYFYRLHRE